MKKLLILFVSIFLFSGCSNHVEINELGIVSSIGIEKIKDEYLVTIQIINIQDSTEKASDESKIITYSESGKTIFEALRHLNNKTSRKLYFSHMKLIIIDDEILETTPLDVVDIFARDSESMLNFYLLVTTDESPNNILKTLTPLENIPAEYIVKQLKTSEKNYGNTFTITFEKYISDLVSKGIEPVFTKISLSNENKSKDSVNNLKISNLFTYIILGNLLIYDENNNLIELSKEESEAFSILNNSAQNGIITLKCIDEEKYYTLEIMENKTDIEYKNNKIGITSKINTSISDYQCKESLQKEETVKDIKDSVKKHFESYNNSLINKTLEYNTDILGIGKIILTTDKKWDIDDYKELSINSKVEISLEKRGNLFNVIKEKK